MPSDMWGMGGLGALQVIDIFSILLVHIAINAWS